jgi:hypothetical protein
MFNQPEGGIVAPAAPYSVVSDTPTHSVATTALHGKYAPKSANMAYANYYFASKKVLPTLVDKTLLRAMALDTLDYIMLTDLDVLHPKYYSETNNGNMLTRGAAFATCFTKAAAEYYANLIPEFELDVEDLKSTVEYAKDAFAESVFDAKHPFNWYKFPTWAVKTGDKYCVTIEFLKHFVSIWLAYARCLISTREHEKRALCKPLTLAEALAAL